VGSFVIGTGSAGALAHVQPDVQLTIRFESIPIGPPP
jgi:hypothetical protein